MYLKAAWDLSHTDPDGEDFEALFAGVLPQDSVANGIGCVWLSALVKPGSSIAVMDRAR